MAQDEHGKKSKPSSTTTTGHAPKQPNAHAAEEEDQSDKDLELTELGMQQEQEKAQLKKCKERSDKVKESYRRAVETALRVRAKVVDSYLKGERWKLKPLLRELEKTPSSKRLLQETGLNHLLQDKEIWMSCSSEAQNLLRKWELILSKVVTGASEEILGPVSVPDQRSQAFGGKGAANFRKIQLAWLERAKKVVPAADTGCLFQLSITLTNFGFTEARTLIGVTEKTIDRMCQGAQAHILKQMVEQADLDHMYEKKKRIEQALCQASTDASAGLPEPINSASVLSSALTDKAISKKREQLEEEARDLALPGLEQAERPRKAIKHVQEAAMVAQQATQSHLLKRAQHMQVANYAGSNRGFASALTLWHWFAVTVWCYNPNWTLPPRETIHILSFIGMFKNGGTAGNYISFLRAACRMGLYSLDWDKPAVSQALTGLKKLNVRWFGGPNGAKYRLTKQQIEQLVLWFDMQMWFQATIAILTAWEFLLRVQSECLRVWHGCYTDPKERPSDRDNGIWIDNDNGEVVIWYRRRKHKPNGTVMRRKCTCATTGKTCCLFHRMASHLQNKKPGNLLWDMKKDEFLKMVQEPLQRMGFTASDEMTLKAFRAGKATQMVEDGKPVTELMDAGEWGTSAFTRYLPKEKSAQGEPYLDRGAIMELAICTSEDEEENHTRKAVIDMARRMTHGS